MNKRAAIGFLLFATALLLWWHRQQPADQATQTPLPTVESRQRQVAATSIAAPKPTPESDPAGWMEMRRKEVEEERQKGLNDWRTPIVFYGRVVDENMNPVSDAKIDFGWTDLSPSGSSEMQTASDNNGSFFLSGVKGKVLTVQVAKSGYYAFKAYPVVFFLRRCESELCSRRSQSGRLPLEKEGRSRAAGSNGRQV